MRAESDRPKYPEHRERFGEDPARLLSSDVDPEPRIRGIQDLGLVNAWLQVARDLDVSRSTVKEIEQRRSDIIRNQP